MNRREQWLTATMIELADTLVGDFDVTEMLDALTGHCADLLDASDVGIVLADEQGTLHAVASSSERMRVLALLELQNDDGPCLDCLHSSAPVEATVLDAQTRALADVPRGSRRGGISASPRAAHVVAR